MVAIHEISSSNKEKIIFYKTMKYQPKQYKTITLIGAERSYTTITKSLVGTTFQDITDFLERGYLFEQEKKYINSYIEKWSIENTYLKQNPNFNITQKCEEYRDHYLLFREKGGSWKEYKYRYPTHTQFLYLYLTPEMLKEYFINYKHIEAYDKQLSSISYETKLISQKLKYSSPGTWFLRDSSLNRGIGEKNRSSIMKKLQNYSIHVYAISWINSDEKTHHFRFAFQPGLGWCNIGSDSFITCDDTIPVFIGKYYFSFLQCLESLLKDLHLSFS